VNTRILLTLARHADPILHGAITQSYCAFGPFSCVELRNDVLLALRSVHAGHCCRFRRARTPCVCRIRSIEGHLPCSVHGRSPEEASSVASHLPSRGRRRRQPMMKKRNVVGLGPSAPHGKVSFTSKEGQESMRSRGRIRVCMCCVTPRRAAFLGPVQYCIVQMKTRAASSRDLELLISMMHLSALRAFTYIAPPRECAAAKTPRPPYFNVGL
jgi:hypothetical protein